MRLVRKMTAAMAAVMAVIMAVYAYLSIADHARSLRIEAERDQRAIALVLAEALAAAYDAGSAESARRLLEDIDSKRGHVRFEWLPAQPDLVPGDVALEERSIRGDRWLTSRTPIVADAGVVGALGVSESLVDVTATIRNRVRRVVFTTLAIFAGAAIVAWILGSRMVGEPVRRLVEQADRLGRGEFDHPLQFAGNDELRQLADAMDVTAGELKQLQARIVSESEARVSAVEQLRHSERLATVGKLAAGIAHELGTPLNVVLARARMLSRDEVSASDRQRYADSVVEQTVRMAQIIRQLLDFARLRPPTRQPTDLVALVEQTRALIRTLADEKSVELKAELPPRGVIGDIDAGQIEQVLTNLLVNALAASPPGSEVSIRVARASATHPDRREPESWLTIEVEDQGHGIPAEDMDRVFEPFFTTKDVGEGTGLGLAVCYGIVKEHGGFIQAESKIGRGTRFVVYLPEGDREPDA